MPRKRVKGGCHLFPSSAPQPDPADGNKLPTPAGLTLIVNPEDPLRSYFAGWSPVPGADWYRVEHRLAGNRDKVWQREVQQPADGSNPVDAHFEEVDRPKWVFEARVQAFRDEGDGSDDSDWSEWASVQLPLTLPGGTLPPAGPIIIVPPSGNSIRLAQGEDLVKAAYAARDAGKELIAQKLHFDRCYKFEEPVSRLRLVECTVAPPAGGLFKGHWLITIRGMTDSIIQANQIEGGGAEAIAGYGDWSRTIVADNTHRDGFEFLHLYEYSGTGLQVLRNLCHNLRRMGVELQGSKAIAQDTLVQGNVITFPDLARTYHGTFGLSIMHNPGIRTRVIGNTVSGPAGNRKEGSWGVAVGIEFSGEDGTCADNVVSGTNESLHIVYAPRAVVMRNQLHDAGHIAIWQTGTQTAAGCKIVSNDIRTKGEVFVFDGGAGKSKDVLVEGNTIAAGYRTLKRGNFGGEWKQ